MALVTVSTVTRICLSCWLELDEDEILMEPMVVLPSTQSHARLCQVCQEPTFYGVSKMSVRVNGIDTDTGISQIEIGGLVV